MKAGDLVRMTKKRAGHPSFRPGIAASYMGIYAEGTSETQDNGASLKSHRIWVEGRKIFFYDGQWRIEVISESR